MRLFQALLHTSFLIVPALAAAPVTANPRNVDTEASQLRWTGSKVIGSSHTGTIKLKSGKIDFTGDKPTAAELIVDMSSIVNEDLTDPEWNKKLVSHLNSDDFFGVEKHPTATLKIEQVQAVKDGLFHLKGNLTIKGTTKPITLTATSSSGPKGTVVKTTLKFDRTDFDIRYGSGRFFENLGDKMIADEVELSAEIVLQGKVTASN